MAKAFVSGIGWAEMQSKAVDITDNGSVDILPDGGNVLGKVTVNTNVPHYDDGYEAGKEAEWNAFWDSLQQNGKRTDYSYAFVNWRKDIFTPKYDISGTDLSQAFRFYGVYVPEEHFDLAEKLERCGVTLDTSKATAMTYMFYSSSVTRSPKIDCASCGTLTNTFNYAPNLVTIDCLKLRDDGTNAFSGTFTYAAKLVNLTIEGVIGKSGLDLQWSTNLSRASIESIINALSTTTSSLTVTLSKTARTNAFTDDEWSTLIATKPNWTISLV